ncbi:AAA family ATPase [Amycolatopsis sp. FDAARGOS 1241]|uniref:AAA family ATPase n=1 Tax=Amycolatopsis sp. FDAARGOS 1241 TaxID=2778070 RepID=UPI00194DEEED|nr:AAA family ATPase [Amycolatopsis sp. FDAARGOS 1241]QRP47097.1 kinase [Amycolatopsis sp. FDAARGOS 1241]
MGAAGDPRLLVLRGPSGAGKTTAARALSRRSGRGTALIEQDVIRREILWEHGVPGGVTPGLLDVMCRHTLAAGCQVILEGILHERRYGPTLRRLVADHRGPSLVCFFDIPFPDTVRRHATRPQSAEFSPADMLGWYVPDDRLRVPGEVVRGPDVSPAGTVALLDAACRDPTGRAG